MALFLEKPWHLWYNKSIAKARKIKERSTFYDVRRTEKSI